MLLFEGCAVALITPFHGEEIDFHALDQLVDFQLENGTDAIVACGTTGEPSTMTEAEWEKVIARVVDRVHGRAPVIAGTGGNNTREAVQKARLAKTLGADAQLCVTPYYNKTTQAGLIAHYTALGLVGGGLFVGEELVAFTLGEECGENAFDVRFEKADPNREGAFAMVNREFARLIQKKLPHIKYLNREEDLGLEALRKAKLSYRPAFMLEKFNACGPDAGKVC